MYRLDDNLHRSNRLYHRHLPAKVSAISGLGIRRKRRVGNLGCRDLVFETWAPARPKAYLEIPSKGELAVA